MGWALAGDGRHGGAVGLGMDPAGPGGESGVDHAIDGEVRGVERG